MSLNPFIFIGVGGTGGKTLGVIRQTLSDALDRIGWRDEWPKGWQFLHIDVPADPDAISEHLPYSLPRTQYVALTDRQSAYTNYSHGITQSLERAVPSSQQRFYDWECWKPHPDSDVRVNIINGAGQYRSIGRICALTSLSKIDNAIGAAFDAASNAEAAPELLRIQHLLGDGQASITDGRPVVFVVGSVAGGSGSGMFQDVCDVVRSQGHQEINAVLFTPEVFQRPDGTTDPGVAPNTFMALSELTNSMWTADVSDAQTSRDHLFTRAGVGHPIGHNGPSTVFLVGRRNGSVVFENAWDVYKIVGRSLAELSMDETLTRDVIAYDVANAQAIAAGGTDGLDMSSGRSQARDLAVYRSLGFSRLSVGREFFEKYAVDRISRAVVVRLIDGHLLNRQPDSNLSDDELLSNAVNEAWGAFLLDSTIDEVDTEYDQHNGISDRLATLRDPRVTKEIKALRDKAMIALQATANRNKVRTTDAGSAVAREVDLGRKSILDKGLVAAADRAREFQVEIQEKLGEVISQRIAEEGLPVTAALITKLIARSNDAVGTLVKNVEDSRVYEISELQKLTTGGVVAPTEFPLDATDQVEAILRTAERAIGRALQAQYFEVTRKVLEDLIEHLLKPWHRAVVDADGLLRREARPANQISVLDIWPQGDIPGERPTVPDYLLPSKVEFLMDRVENFPTAFEGVIEDSISGVKGGAAVRRAISEVAAGINLGRQSAATEAAGVVRYEMNWSPEWDMAREPKQSKSTARIKLRLSLSDIRNRAHDWLWDDEKSSGRYLRMTLSNHLTDPLASETERDERTERLLGLFQAMVKASLPLIAVEPTMAQAIHSHAQPPYNLYTTALNVPKELAPKLAEIAHALLNAPQNILTTTSPKSGAMMMTLLREPYHMIEIASIMDPVVDQWSTMSKTNDFWLWRRARPLPEWVPLSPNALADLIRGWFVGRLTGSAYIGGEDGTELIVDMNGTASVIARHGVRPRSKYDHVGNIVEGVATASLEGYRIRSLEPLAPYRWLISLGGALENEENSLQQWVIRGGRSGAREYERLNCDTSDQPGRTKAAATLLDTWIDTYSSDSKNFADTHQAQRHPTYELNSHILHALQDVKTSLWNIDSGSAIR